jgi:hypothetical protein
LSLLKTKDAVGTLQSGRERWLVLSISNRPITEKTKSSQDQGKSSHPNSCWYGKPPLSRRAGIPFACGSPVACPRHIPSTAPCIGQESSSLGADIMPGIGAHRIW